MEGQESIQQAPVSPEPKKRKSVKKNYIYNVIYQLFLVLVPLIVTPYISRVLSPEGVGESSFSYSLIAYFTIFGSLGFGYYAQREIAKYQNQKENQSRIFWEINLCRLVSVGIALLLNIMMCLFQVYDKYTLLMWVFSINIFAIAFDISFFFQGNEEFGKLVLRNVIIKAISIACIFIFVKNEQDVWIYALINAAMLIVSNLSMWGYLPKLLVRIPIKSLRPFKHLKGTLKLFIPTIATSIYTVLDRTLIGVLIPDTYTVIENGKEVVKRISDLENGLYEQSEKLVKMAMTIITCFGSVMIPRNSYEISQGNLDKVRQNIYTSSRLVWLVGVPMVLGLIATASNFVPWFYGEGYEKCIPLISIFSVLILLIGFSNIFGLQYLVPSGHDKSFTIALLLGAVLNLILNCILIPFYWSFGAAIASIIAECIVTITMGIMVSKQISLKKIILCSWKYLLSGIVMFIPAWFIGKYLESSILNSIIIVGCGIVIYGVMLLILKEQFLYGFLRKIFKRKKVKTNS